MQKLISELKRLYFYKGQIHHDQDKTGESYFPAGNLTPAILEEHLAGDKTIALNLVAEDGTCRAMVFDFDGVAHGKGKQHWERLADLANKMQTELGLPAPAVAVSGRKGWGLWLSLEQPVPAAQAQQFLHLVRKAYLADIPKDELDLRPDTDKATKAAQAVAKLPPCLHRASGLWAAFINPGMGASFIEEAGLPAAPPLGKQAELLADLKSITPMQFMQALYKLQQKTVASPKDTKGPMYEPLYKKAEPGYLPPCISSLVEQGAPHGMQYNVANVNLYAYCASAKLAEDTAAGLALRMAQASEDHPTSKATEVSKVKNFHSNHNAAKTFYCDFARNTPNWAKQYGGLKSCEGCKLNPGIAHDKQTSQKEAVSPLLEEQVALDLLAYARDRKEPLPQIRYVWPQQALLGEVAPFYLLAAQALDKGLASAAFFGEVDKYISEKHIYVSQQDVWKQEAKSFFDQVQAHQVTEEAGKAALQRATHLERRLTLTNAVREAIKQGPEVAANVVAMQLRGAAEASLKAEQGAGPIATLRNELFKGLARQDSAVVPTPFPRLNGLLHGGLRGGRLYTLIAPPKSGKTTVAGAIMDHAASLGYPCLYVGYEMAREQMVEYALARRESINSRRIETRDLSEQEAERLASSLDSYLAQTGQYLELWEAGMTTSIADMAAWVTRVKAEHPDKTPMVVIDYLQLAYTGIPEIDRHPSETKRVTEVAVACKHLARQTGAAVLALSSVTKAAENDSRLSGEIDVTAARDSLAIIHASDGVLAMQTATVRVTEGKGDNKTESELDPWGFMANQLRAQNRESDAVTLERALLKLEKAGYAQGGYGYGVRARLSLLRHRGSTGDVALYYRQAFHSLEEVALPGMEALETGNHNSDISISVFQKYVNTPAEAMTQDPLPGFEEVASPSVNTEGKQKAAVAYEYLTDQAAALAAVAKLEGLVGIDLETTGLSPLTAQARLLQLSDVKQTLVIDLWKAGGLAAFKKALEPLHLVAHNAVFEMGFLYRAGVEVKLDCTMLASHVLTGKRVGLKALAQQYLDLDMSKEEQVSDWSAETLTESQLSYAALDALAVAQIFPLLEEELAQRDSEKAYRITRDAQPCIVRMELAGMGFDSEKQQTLISTLTTQRDAYLATLAEALEGRNPASGAQLSEWITEQLGGETGAKYAAWPKTPTGKLKTGGDDLRKGLLYLPDAAAKVISEALLPYKDAEKKLSAFGSSLADKIDPSTQRIHADFNLAGTETGRMSCSKPNLQQIPRDKEFRALFAAPAGRVYAICDYSQMELRVAAQIAGEEALIEAYKQGQDTHRKTAALLLGIPPGEVTKDQRQLAKAVNFGLLFGQGAKGLQAYASSSYGVEITEDQARKYRDAWFTAYPAIKVWHNKSGKAAEKSLSVRTPAGRERRWASAKDFAVTAAYNTPVQGGAAEAMLASLAHLEKALQGLDAVPIAVVHDEVIVECAAEIAEQVKGLLEQAMIQGFKDIFPEAPVVDVVEASIGQTWADK